MELGRTINCNSFNFNAAIKIGYMIEIIILASTSAQESVNWVAEYRVQNPTTIKI
jgi:hypothetical protein